MRTNYVLIDYENVQPTTIAALVQDHFKIIVFIGANQTKIPLDIAIELHRMGSRAEYVKICGAGSNTLDFHIAFYIGQLEARDPDAFFHIISRDTGFDPLIQHLRSNKILACHSGDITDMPGFKAAQASALSEKVTVIVSNLTQRGASKPRTVKTLSSTINTLFPKPMAEAELASVVRELQTRGLITITNDKITYTLSG